MERANKIKGCWCWKSPTNWQGTIEAHSRLYTFRELRAVWQRCAILSGSTLAVIHLGGRGSRRPSAPAPGPGWSYAAGQFPAAPPSLPPSDQDAFERGWQALVMDNLEVAARLLENLSRQHRGDPYLGAALGYLGLRSGNRPAAVRLFPGAL